MRNLTIYCALACFVLGGGVAKGEGEPRATDVLRQLAERDLDISSEGGGAIAFTMVMNIGDKGEYRPIDFRVEVADDGNNALLIRYEGLPRLYIHGGIAAFTAPG